MTMPVQQKVNTATEKTPWQQDSFGPLKRNQEM